ncbi:four helix bundle protein [Olivibacter sp. XZL3]|uniref:four helix bundle protein n=1 Tax=Olivibacter sp. XZL3 TaxID=1735116 RepID=UPI0010664FDA|nr:four helix bundle protein [Olivibacter sp. XZL3]
MATGSFKELRVYQLAYAAARKIFLLSKSFPKEETYALTDQIRRSSRSVCANIGEGYRKRIYPKHFVTKMSDADGEATETTIWLDFALDCGYIVHDDFNNLQDTYSEIGKMLNAMINNPNRFLPKNNNTNTPATATASATSNTITR